MLDVDENKNDNKLEFLDLGLIDFEDAFTYQLKMLEQCKSVGTSCILALEHHPVITIGKFASNQDLKIDQSELSLHNIKVVQTDRGGKMTAHMPGQLVVYPILNLYHYRLTPKKYVLLLENTIVEFLSIFTIDATIDNKHPGVWVGNNKIAALGIRFVSHYSMHGLALNINNKLDLFDTFTPCGIQGRGVTSVSKELSQDLSVDNIKDKFVSLLIKKLNFQICD